jgi:uncharacterized protein
MYEWDGSKNTLNIAKHGVSFELAQRIFDGPVLTVRDDLRDYGEVREVSIGMVDGMAVLTIVHNHRSHGQTGKGADHLGTARIVARKETL